MDRILISQIVSTFIFLLILFGVFKRKHKETHMKIMLSAFILDICLIVFIESGKNAIATALGFPGGLLGFHIIVSVLTVIIYIWMIYTGFNLYFGRGDKSVHKTLAYVFLVLRATNLITSFFIG